MSHLSTTKTASVMYMSVESWRAINDNVMGGLSWGGIALNDEGLHLAVHAMSGFRYSGTQATSFSTLPR